MWNPFFRREKAHELLDFKDYEDLYIHYREQRKIWDPCRPAGCKHTIIAETKLSVMELQLGKDISVDDKQKYDL